MRRLAPWLAAVSLLVALAACRGKAPDADRGAEASAPASAAEGTAAVPASPAAGAAAPQVPPLPAHPPAEAGGAAPNGTPTPAAPDQGAPEQPASTLAFDLPAGWRSTPPATRMRLAQATLAGPGGPAELGVFYFGPGQGGSADANIARWTGQISGGKPQQGSFTANGLKVTWVDARGTLKASSMGMGPSSEQPNARLLGAVVEGPGGPWFFKATGPEATLGPQRDAFLAMLHGLRLKPGQSA
jgi:hypothetical protein